MRVIGLTGSIACGKSTVSQTLRRLGAQIIDGDEIAHRLYAPDGAALEPIRQAFGDGVFLQNGSVDRRALGQAVFGDEEALARLDAIMQPLILQDIHRQMREAEAAGCSCCVLDMPLLYEKQLDRLCDSVWCVWLPHQIQLERLIQRDGMTAQDAQRRIASQLSADEKAARADVVIDTSGSIEETAARLLPLWQHEMAQA